MLLSGNMALMYLLDVCTMAFFFFFLFTILPFTSFRKMSAVCRKKTGWHLAPEKHNELIEKKNPKLIVCGDSIVSGLGRYKDVWQTHFNEMTVNLGEPGDRVEHLLWRLQKLCPSRSITTAFILCGTNNIEKDIPERIVTMLFECCRVLTGWGIRVVLSHILPRDGASDITRDKLRIVNTCLDRRRERGVYVFPAVHWLMNDGGLSKKLYF